MSDTSNTYDAVPYPSYAFAHTHPDALGTLARVFGMSPVPPDRARVLEIGCASGGNLIPMAVAYPGATFVGFDLSARQIEEGRRQAAALGLTNLDLQPRDILQPTDDLGTFDYIIAHGVFSWVPQLVQEAIFALARKHLSPQGVAYISYNTRPGWQMHGAVRDMMLYMTADVPEPMGKVAHATAMLDWLAAAVPGSHAAYHRMLNQVSQTLKTHNQAYVLHEFLEEVNDPQTFVGFMDRAHRHGLQYLGESGLTAMLDQYFDPQVQQTLRGWSRDIFELEQYMDFLRGRTFRQTLLVHREVALQRDLTSFRADGMWLSSRALTPDLQLDPAADAPLHLKADKGEVELSLDDPLAKAVLLQILRAWPATIRFEDAFDAALDQLWPGQRNLLDPDWIAAATHSLSLGLLNCAALQLCQLHVSPGQSRPWAGHPRPEVWPYTRHLAARTCRVSSPRHETVDLDSLDQHLVTLLDGHHTVDDVLDRLRAKADAYQLATGEPLPDAPTPDKVRARIQQFSDWGLLVQEAP